MKTLLINYLRVLAKDLTLCQINHYGKLRIASINYNCFTNDESNQRKFYAKSWDTKAIYLK